MNSKLKNIMDQIPKKKERLDIFGINDIQEKWKNKHKIFCKSKEIPVESVILIRDTIYDLYDKASNTLVKLEKHYDNVVITTYKRLARQYDKFTKQE